MLKPILTLVSAIFLNVFTASAQQDSIPDKIYSTDEITKKPSFPGGEPVMQSFLINHLNYPAEARKKKISGLVALSFVIEKDGSITNITILKSPDESISAESIRVVEAMPDWFPGELEGDTVRVKFVLPLRFKL